MEQINPHILFTSIPKFKEYSYRIKYLDLTYLVSILGSVTFNTRSKEIRWISFHSTISSDPGTEFNHGTRSKLSFVLLDVHNIYDLLHLCRWKCPMLEI